MSEMGQHVVFLSHLAKNMPNLIFPDCLLVFNAVAEWLECRTPDYRDWGSNSGAGKSVVQY